MPQTAWQSLMFDAQTREARDGVRGMRWPHRRYGAASYPDAGAARDLLLRRLGALVPADGSLADELPHAITDVYSTPHRQAVIEPAARSPLRVLVDGWLLRAAYLHDGACQITEILVPGDLSTNFTSDGDPASVLVACGTARIAMLDLDALSPPARTVVEQGLHIARREEVRRLHTRLVTIGRRDARARLAQFMAETYARLAARRRPCRGWVFRMPADPGTAGGCARPHARSRQSHPAAIVRRGCDGDEQAAHRDLRSGATGIRLKPPAGSGPPGRAPDGATHGACRRHSARERRRRTMGGLSCSNGGQRKALSGLPRSRQPVFTATAMNRSASTAPASRIYPRRSGAVP